MIENDTEITEPFYIKKFMEIQRQNVVLSNLLRDIASDTYLKKAVENHLGNDVFDILKDTPA
jgi:hypothetical protein